MLDVAVIGCGIIGAATAYELSKYRISVIVLEKDNDVANGATKANSAIIHAGYDPEPGTLMAKLNVEGSRLAKGIFEKLDIPYRQCGSIVAAFSSEDMDSIKRLYKRGMDNGVPHMRLLESAEARRLEPNLSEKTVGALLAPSAMIVSPWEYALALVETAVRNGVKLHLESGVENIQKIDGGWRLVTGKGKFEAKYILNAAGVHADIIHNMAAPPAFNIVPDRGEYYLLDKSEGSRVNHVIFQCPSKLGKGALIAPTVHGNLIVGPNNEKPDDRDDVAVTLTGLEWVAEKARKSVPSLNLRTSIRNFSGIRARSDKDDFIIAQADGAPGFFDLAGIKSPGLSAAPAIARMAAGMLKKSGLALEEKDSFTDARRRVRFAELSADEKAALAAANPAYGRVICRCETVTEGEILDALDTPVPPRSVDAVKRRCNAGMGRCQGGFCGPKIVRILSERLQVNPTEILQDKAGAYILTGETKTAGGEQDAI